jgi:hypothetical protein
MDREWTLARTDRQTIDDGILGELFTGDQAHFCFTLERPEVAITAGRYRVRLTVSTRAQRGELWTPRQDFKLPEILGVVGRSGLRLHALNEPRQSLGCPGVGFSHTDRSITTSRPALEKLIDVLQAADDHDDAVWLTISEPEQVTAARV